LEKPGKYSKKSDELLMIDIDAGSHHAFDELYRRYKKRVLYFFYRMLWGDEEKAKDLSQDLFYKIIHKSSTFNPSKKFSTWLFSIANNMCKNEYQKMQTREIIVRHEGQEVPAENKEPGHVMDARILENHVQAFIDELDEDTRSMFIMRYREELPIREISNITGINEGTVKSSLFYARKKIREKILKITAIHHEKCHK
jgi:RNA polymerase sigma-70 factor (ECF subfamily)